MLVQKKIEDLQVKQEKEVLAYLFFLFIPQLC